MINLFLPFASQSQFEQLNLNEELFHKLQIHKNGLIDNIIVKKEMKFDEFIPNKIKNQRLSKEDTTGYADSIANFIRATVDQETGGTCNKLPFTDCVACASRLCRQSFWCNVWCAAVGDLTCFAIIVAGCL